MEKNLEKSLKRFLKRKVKITMGLVVSFLITGMVSFAEGNTKGADKKTETKKISAEEYIINEELLKNILREINFGNIHIIKNGETVEKTQEIGNGKIGINDGIVSGYYKAQNISGGIGINNNELTTRGEYDHTYGQFISNGLGINNGTINIPISRENNYGQNIENNSLGINNGILSGKRTQFIHDNGLGINNGTISGTYAGQYIIYNAIGINNGTIKANYNIQSLADRSLGINNGILSGKTDSYGQDIANGGVGINNGVIFASRGQNTGNLGGTGINNGIIIANDAYVSERGGETFHKNGIALKKDGDKLVLNGDMGQAGNNENLTEKSGDFENNFTDQTIQKEKNIFINNLEGENNKLNLISNSYDGVHITTAVSKESSFTENETVITTENNFSSLNKSTIIGYFEKNGTLIDMNGATNITLTDSVISAIAGNSDTGFNGNALTDVNAIKFAEGSKVTLNNSTVNGKMKFSAGDNTLNLNGKYNGINSSTYTDGTQHGTYVSDVEFGKGSDEIHIKFDGENENAVYSSKEDKKGLVTLGNVNFGDGNDTLSFSFDEMRKGNFVLAGNVDFGAGNDDKIVFKSSLADDNGESLVLMNNLLFNKITAGTLETLQLADSGNTIRFEQNIGQDKLSLDFNGKILGGKGDDKFIVSVDKLKNNLTSLNGGADENKNPYNDNDILELTTAVDNTSDVILFKNVENVETLKLADIDGNKLDINNISTSNPDTLRFKNYIGGDKDDNFTVSVDHFEKLSLIDGGGNKTAGDTLKIDGFKLATNIKEDGTIDDTFFNKIQNIENLEFGSFTDAQLNLNNLTSEYLKNLNIKLGGITNEIYISTNNLKELKGLTGKGNTALKITNAVTEREETFDFLEKGNGTNGVNSIKKIHFSENDDTINLNNLNTANSEIIKIYGEGGNDTFITSLETLGKIGQLDGGKGGERNSLEITDTLILNNETNPNVFENVYDIEKLVLSGTGNNIVIDNLVSDDPTQTFSEVIGTNGGEKGNTFIINGDTQDSNRNTAILEMAINGGGSKNDTLKINTEIKEYSNPLYNKKGIENLELGLDVTKPIDYNIELMDLNDFKNIKSGNGNDTFELFAFRESNIGSIKIDGGGNHDDGQDTLKIFRELTDENALSGVSNIENLELVTYRETTLNINNTNGFISIKGGEGKEIFKVSAEKLGTLSLLDGGTFPRPDIDKFNDRLELTTAADNITTNKTLFDSVKNIEELVLAENSSNNIDLDNLSFKNITAKNGDDTFKILADKLGNFTVTGGTGNDTLEVKTALSNGESLKNYTEIETLKLSDSGNEFTLNSTNAGGNNFKNIIFGKDLTNNTITLANDLGTKNITFETLDETNKVSVDSTADVNGVKTFEHTITNAGRIELAQGSSEWKFGEKSLITGNTTVDFGNNILNLVENKNTIDFDNINETAKLNTGNLGLNTDGTLSMGDLSFVENNSRITVENAEIKIGFNETVKFAEGVNTKPFTITDGKEIAFGTGVTFTSPYEFIKIDGTNISVKQWNEYEGYYSDFSLYAGRYDEILKKYNGTDEDSIAVTNALNGFSEENIFKFVTDKQGDKLVYYSNEDGTPYDTKVTGEDILIKTNPDTAEDQDMNLTFNNISSSGNIKIEVTGGKDNTVTFGKGGETFVAITSGDENNKSVIDGSSSKENLTLNFFGKTNNADKIVIDNQNKNTINIRGNTVIKEITLGDGADTIYAGENSQNITINKINFGAGDDTLNIGSTGTINLSEINLGAGNNKIYFNDISKVEKFDVVKSEGDNGTNEIFITETKDSKDKFNLILAGSDKDVEKITVWGENKLQITNDFSGELLFDKSSKNVIDLKTAYTGNIKFTNGENTVNISSGSIDGTKLSFAGSKNILNVNGGTVTNGITFEENSYGNKVIVSQDGVIGKAVKFGTGVGDEFTIALRDGGIFDYNVTNADVINISGIKGEINFGENSSITSNSEITLNTKGGVIAFDINKSGDITSKNPFGTSSVKVNGDIKITLDSSVKFESLSDTIKLGLGNIKSDSILTSAFLDYKDGVISIKSADKLTGLNETSYGNYEHIILNYNNGKEYAEITEKLNTGSLSDIVSMLNGGITKGSYYFYSDQRTLGEEVENQIVLGNIFVKTSEDTNKTAKDTDVTFKNITGKTAELSFAENTKNSVSFLEGTVLNKIDGTNSKSGFTLTLDGVNFSKSQDEKENEDKANVVMSGHDDILNINSSINNINLNAGAGNDTVNILSSANGIFDGNEGRNILNIGAKTQTLSDENSQNEIVLNGEIKNFGEINLNQNTKFESSLKISQNNQSEKINLNLNGNNLFIDVDYSKVSDDNKVIGHALYDNGIKVDNSTGKVMIDTAKSDNGTIISLGKDNKTEFANQENILESGSSNHHIEFVDGDIVVKINEHIMGDDETGGAIKYAHLDKIYQSIVSADKIKEMSKTTTLLNKTKDEAIKAQLEFYGKIYHSTPYAYSNDVSKKSADLITESIMNLKVMPEYKHWVFGGSIAGQEADSNSNFYGSNYYTGIDIGKNEISADTNIYGAYAFGKYGIGVNQSIGFALAGTRSDTDILGNSKLEGDAVYISAFAEQEINNLKLTAGISYQHSFYDSTRNVSNDYQRMSVDKKYEDDLISVFAGGKYSYHLGNNFFAEPKVKLSVTHVMQNSIDEGDNGKLTIETDKKDFTFVEGEVGIDLVKKVNLSKGTLSLKAGTSLVYSIEGYEEEYLTGRITGSSKDFEMISPEDDRTRVKFTVGTEYEMTNGMFMNLHGNYTTSSHAEDYAVSFGAGYRF